MTGLGPQDWHALRRAVKALLVRPMTTQEVLDAMKKRQYAEEPVRVTLRYLADDGEIERPSNRQIWELVQKA